ncbi:B3/B4 domain-containing protein [Halalkalibacterium ligniniphilum]|uniref:B3/B4 domain-containing protein n=1 Tax=Halalkalibacterium ligniniphilum TaxID=1134413 RepID=UPI0003478B54|nr:B3/4 domain-containing protein [Halalkalibacterium ligniniphilum]
MKTLTIASSISSVIPSFKVGVIVYHDIVIGDSPQMLKGRMQFFQEEVRVSLETSKSLTDYTGLAVWRQTFKQLGIDPARYRPSVEALYRRIKKGQPLPQVNSAVDLNNFFSLEYEIPFGIYDFDKIDGNIRMKIGESSDDYEGVNGRDNQMEGKIVTTDNLGAFGSPIVDSLRTSVTEATTSAIQIAYIRPSMEPHMANQLLKAAASMFVQIHGGTSSYSLVTADHV